MVAAARSRTACHARASAKYGPRRRANHGQADLVRAPRRPAACSSSASPVATPLVGASAPVRTLLPGNSPSRPTRNWRLSRRGGASHAHRVSPSTCRKSGGTISGHSRRGQHDRFQSDNLSQELINRDIIAIAKQIARRANSADASSATKLWCTAPAYSMRSSNTSVYSEAPAPMDGLDAETSQDQLICNIIRRSGPYHFVHYKPWFARAPGVGGGSRRQPDTPREAVRSFWYDPTEWNGELQARGNRMSPSAFRQYSILRYNAQPGRKNCSTCMDLTTQLNLGPSLQQTASSRTTADYRRGLPFCPDRQDLEAARLRPYLNFTLWNGTGRQPDGKQGNYELISTTRCRAKTHYPIAVPDEPQEEYGSTAQTAGASRGSAEPWAQLITSSICATQTESAGQFGSAGTFETREVNKWLEPARASGVLRPVRHGRTVRQGPLWPFSTIHRLRLRTELQSNKIERSLPLGRRERHPRYDRVSASRQEPPTSSAHRPLNNILNRIWSCRGRQYGPPRKSSDHMAASPRSCL